MYNFDLVDFLRAGGLNRPVELLKEDIAPGFADRKQGEPLPTLESVKAAHQAKNGIVEKNNYSNSEEDFTDRMVMEKIFDIIKYHELDPSEVLEVIGQEYGIDFEFQ